MLELSIVIPIRDNWQQLLSCLDSIAAQSFPPSFEVILVDDGSLSPMPACLEKRLVQLPIQIKRQTRLGIAAARNFGIASARAEMIVFTDSDCLLDPYCLRNLIDTSRRLPDEVAFQFSLSSPENNLVQRVEKFRLKSVQTSLLTHTGHIPYANTSGFALRFNYVMQFEEFFDVGVIRGSDTLMLARLIRAGIKPRFLPECKVLHCPEMSFPHYALKHFRIGYHEFASLQRLQSAGREPIGWREKGRVFRQSFSGQEFSWSNIHCGVTAVFCLVIKKLGRAGSRLCAVHPGERWILGTRADLLRSTELIYHIATKAKRKQSFLVSYANSWTLVQSKRSESFRSLLNRCDLCFVDGVGVNITAISLNQPRTWKITANNFIFDLCHELACQNLTVALIGAKSNIVSKARQIFTQAVPGLKIVMHSPGFFSLLEEQILIEQLRATKPGVIFIGMGQPLQEEWAAKIKPLFPESVLVCVGGLFDYLTTSQKNSLDIARKVGFEWMLRLLYDHRKTASRYLHGIPALFGYILAENCRRTVARLKNILLSK